MGGWQQQDWALLISAFAFVAAALSAGFTGWQGWSSNRARQEAEKQTALAEQALEHDREARDLFLKAQEREQASKVSAWCRDDNEFVPGPGHVQDGVMAPAQYDSPWKSHLRNASDSPVFDVVVLFSQGSHRVGTDAVDVVPPNAIAERKIPEHSKAEARLAASKHGYTLRPLISFRDAAGRRWRRELDGNLTRLD